MKLTIQRLAVYLITYLVILSVFFTLTDFWKQLDMLFYKSIYIGKDASQNKLSNKITVVSIEKPNLDSRDASLKLFRKQIISFLKIIDSSYQVPTDPRPKAILLDISFSKDTIQLKELKNQLNALKAKRIKVYAVYDLQDYYNKDKTPIYEINDAGQAQMLYDSVFEGKRLHAGFRVENGIIFYPSDLFLVGAFSDSVKIESIVKRVALDDNNSKNFSSSFEQLVTPLGPKDEIQKQTYSFLDADSNSTSIGKFIPWDPSAPALDLHDKYILVGDLKNDFQKDIETPRTYFMAWALNEKIITEKMVRQPMDNLAIIIGQVIFFSLFTVFVFALLFKYVKTLQTKATILALISLFISSLSFILYGIVIYAFNLVIPVGLTLVGMAIAAFLSRNIAHKFLVTAIAPGSQEWDVFISYSHSQSDWVKQNVYFPLKEFKKPNGKPLKIFFDEKSIRMGEAFTSTYMWGIVNAKFFISIYSPEYYAKPHCRNEIDLAYSRSLSDLITMFGIAFTPEAVPEIFRNKLFISITESKFMEIIEKAIIEKEIEMAAKDENN